MRATVPRKSVLGRLVNVTEINPRFDGAFQRRSSTRAVWVALAIAGLLPAFILTSLLALSIDEYQSYGASIAEFGGAAAANADEAAFGIQLSSVLIAFLWLFITGSAAVIAASTRLPVLRTVATVGGGLALFVGLMLFLGLTIGTA